MPLSSRVIKGGCTDQVHLLGLRRLREEAARTTEAPDPLEKAHREAAAVLAEARAQAAGLVAGAEEEAHRRLGEAEAQKEAWREEARAEGYAAGLAQAERNARETREKAAMVLASAEQERIRLLSGLEEELAQLALTIARQVVARELGQTPAAVMAIAREALELVRNRERITVYANPAEADLFRARRGDLEGSLSDRALLVIIADAGVPPGGVRVETEQGLVDATLEARFAAVREALKPAISEKP